MGNTKLSMTSVLPNIQASHTAQFLNPVPTPPPLPVLELAVLVMVIALVGGRVLVHIDQACS